MCLMIFLMFEEFSIVASHEFVVSLGIRLLLVSVVAVVLVFGVISYLSLLCLSAALP